MDADLVGKILHIKTSDGEYNGNVVFVDEKNQLIKMNNVKVLPDMATLPGVQRFYSNEILEKRILTQNTPKATSSADLRDAKGRRLVKEKEVPPHLRHVQRLAAKSARLSEKCLPNGINSSTTETGSKPNIQFTVIETMDSLFDDAIEHLDCMTEIGISMEILSMCQNMKLSWISISTRKHVFLFDVMALGLDCISGKKTESGFQKGLAFIFESDAVVKIMHDCRQVSQYLQKMLNVQLFNVFDTQVADAFVLRTKKLDGQFARYVRSLPSCLKDYLNMDPKLLFFERYREKYMEEDMRIWEERPLPQNLQLALVSKVEYLIKLRSVFLSELLSDYMFGVQIYLKAENSKKDSSHLLPEGFLKFDGKGFVEMRLQGNDPFVSFRRDINKSLQSK